MIKLFLNIIIFAICIFIYSCSKKIDKNLKYIEKPDDLYLIAKQYLDNSDYDNAESYFNKIIAKFPLSNEGIQSQIMLAFIDYINMDYQNAIYNANLLIKKYPSYKDIEYVYYLKALCYYEQIRNEQLDNESNELALKNFEIIINLFPNSKYVVDSKQKIIAINENIAAKNMNIGLFYQREKKFVAAINRFNEVVKEHSTSKFVAEALHRQVEIYFTLGMIEDAKKTAAVLAYNYPKSIWYKNSYSLLNNSKNKKQNKILNKISNFLGNKDEEEL